MRSQLRGSCFGPGLLILSGACSSGVELPEPVSKLVVAPEGGKPTSSSSDGSELGIPGGALSADTTVTLSRVAVSEGAELQLTALLFEPEGVLLERPALTRLPLPTDWPARAFLLEMEGKGTDPLYAAPFHLELPVSGASGKYIAEAKVHHLSARVASRSCRAGTVKRVLEVIQARGAIAGSSSRTSAIDSRGSASRRTAAAPPGPSRCKAS